MHRCWRGADRDNIFPFVPNGRHSAEDVTRSGRGPVLRRRVPARRSLRQRAPPVGRRGAPGAAPDCGRPGRRRRPGRARARRAAGEPPRSRHRRRRPPRRSAAGRAGRRRRLPDDGDVRGVRSRRPGDRGGLPGQRGQLLATRPGTARAHHADRAHLRRRGRPLGDAAHDRQPGADAGLPARAHGPLGRAGGALPRDSGSSTSRSTTTPSTRSRRPSSTSRPGRPRRSGRATSSGATGPAAVLGPPSGASCSGTR